MDLVFIRLDAVWKEPAPKAEPQSHGAPRLDGLDGMRAVMTGGTLIMYGVNEGPGSPRNLLDHPLFAFNEPPEAMDAKWRYVREMTPPPEGDEEGGLGSTWLRAIARVDDVLHTPARRNTFNRGGQWDNLISDQRFPTGSPPVGSRHRSLRIDLGVLDGRDDREPAIRALEAYFERELRGVPFLGPWGSIELARQIVERQEQARLASGGGRAERHPEPGEFAEQARGRVFGAAERLQMLSELGERGSQARVAQPTGATGAQDAESAGLAESSPSAEAQPAARKTPRI